MANIKVYGTVINYANYKDNDKMLSILSPEMGLVSVKAKSCKKPKSQLLQAADLFVTGEFVIYQSMNRNTLTSCTVENNFFNIRLDSYKLACGSYILQLCNAIIQENEECKDLYGHLLCTLKILSDNNEIFPLVIVNAFLFPFLIYSGYKPRFKHCIRCGTKINKDIDKAIAFDMENGGFICSKCAMGIKTTVNPEEYREILRLVDSQTIDEAVKTKTDKKTQKNIFNLLCNYLEIQLQQKFKASKFLLD